jgi:hypothetical protein
MLGGFGEGLVSLEGSEWDVKVNDFAAAGSMARADFVVAGEGARATMALRYCGSGSRGVA